MISDNPIRTAADKQARKPTLHEQIFKILRECEPGTFKMVPKDQLQSDTSYQRQHVQAKIVKTVCANYSHVLFGVLSVCKRQDGRLFVIDGQTRASAAHKIAALTHLPCMLYELSDERAEALAFLLGCTQRGNINSVDKYNARLQARDPAATFIHKLLSASGCKISTSSARMTLNCPTLLLEWADSLSKELTRLWPIFANLLKEEKLDGNVLRALMYIERRMPKGTSLTDPRWYTRINEVGPKKLNDAWKVYTVGGRHGEDFWADGIVDAINKNLKGNRLKIRKALDDNDAGEYA